MQKWEDIAALDGVLSKSTRIQSPQREDHRVHGLNSEVEELRKANRVLKEEKEWNGSRLAELEDQIGKLKIGGSLRKKCESPITNSRLVWPRMNATNDGRKMIDQPKLL